MGSGEVGSWRGGCKDVFELGAKKVNNDICHCFALAHNPRVLWHSLRSTFSISFSLILDKLLLFQSPP